MSYVIIFLIGVVVVLAAILFAQRQVEEEKRELEKPAPHVHRWRQITEFARQCDDRKCAVLEVGDGAPEGMPEYLRLMTTTRAREHPIEEAEIYAQLDPKMNTVEGAECPECFRIYPKYFPWCPYCDSRPIPHMIYDEATQTFTEATPESLVRLEQERRERRKKLYEPRPIEKRPQLVEADRPSERANSGNQDHSG